MIIFICIQCFLITAHIHVCLSDDNHCKKSQNKVMQCSSKSSEGIPHLEQSTSMAVVPYIESNNILSVFRERSREFSFVGHKIHIDQDWDALGVAAVVWDAAIVLSRYLEAGHISIKGRSVIELGAGSGLVGIVAALIGGDVTVTERKVAIPYLQNVVNKNLGDLEEVKVKIQQLDWEKDLDTITDTYDIILGADVIYIEETFPGLLATLLKLANGKTEVYLSCKIRYDRDRTFINMMKSKFTVTKVFMDVEKDIRIYKAVRRIE